MKYRSFFPIILAVLLVLPPFASGQKMNAEEVLTKHLNSIAPVEKRASIKSLIAVGDVMVEYITQKSQPAVGRAVLASDGSKVFMGMNLNAADYPQEKIVFDGSRTSVDFIRSGSRSLLGTFVHSSPQMISQGLLAGPLTTAWAAMGTDDVRSRFSFSGTKKIDGKEVYALTYDPKGGSDVEIMMYFDAKTFHHLRTEYKRTSSASIGRTIDDSARQSESRLKVTEDFSVYKETQGMTLPHQYKILYSISGARGTTEVRWTSQFTEFAFNQALDPATFRITP